MARLCPLFSGSSGNSYYIGSQSGGLLLDAGKSARQLTCALTAAGIDPLAVQAVLVTHEHIDHISGLRVFAKKYDIPVYASMGTVSALQQMGVSDGSFDCCVAEPGDQLCCGDFAVTVFRTSHDCAESCGFRITFPDGRSLVYATDTGILTPDTKKNLLCCDFAVIESNHDVEMLRTGPYPYPLKKRILSPHGHLSNADCAAFLPAMVQNGTTRLMLAHLSAENNTPRLAYDESLRSLTGAGLVQNRDFQLFVAPRENTEHRSITF